MLKAILVQEWRNTRRDRRALAVVGLFVALALVSLLATGSAYSRMVEQRATATEADRAIWEGQGAVNAHAAAHFGQYAFRPPASLFAFDPGLTAWLGQAIWLESHYQNPAEARPAESNLVIQRFGDLSPAWIIQALLPLMVILCGFGAVASERDSGLLRLLLAQGARPLTLLLGKASALWLGASAIAGGYLLVALGVAAARTAADADLLYRALGLLAVHGIYLAVWACLTVAVSARAGSARQALIVLLLIWAIAVVFAPRLASAFAEHAHPTPTAGTFWADFQKAAATGIDGHDPKDARNKALMQKTLQQYGVSSPAELPVDFAAIALQASEEYGNRIFDRFYSDIAAQEDAQRANQRWFALVSPLIALRPLSMSLAGTDLDHQRDFLSAAEVHRREVQRRLNEEQMRTGKGMNFTNTVSPAFWRDVRTFTYTPPRIGGLLHDRLADALACLFWLLGAGSLLAMAAARLEKRP